MSAQTLGRVALHGGEAGSSSQAHPWQPPPSWVSPRAVDDKAAQAQIDAFLERSGTGALAHDELVPANLLLLQAAHYAEKQRSQREEWDSDRRRQEMLVGSLQELVRAKRAALDESKATLGAAQDANAAAARDTARLRADQQALISSVLALRQECKDLSSRLESAAQLPAASSAAGRAPHAPPPALDASSSTASAGSGRGWPPVVDLSGASTASAPQWWREEERSSHSSPLNKAEGPAGALQASSASFGDGRASSSDDGSSGSSHGGAGLDGGGSDALTARAAAPSLPSSPRGSGASEPRAPRRASPPRGRRPAAPPAPSSFQPRTEPEPSDAPPLSPAAPKASSPLRRDAASPETSPATPSSTPPRRREGVYSRDTGRGKSREGGGGGTRPPPRAARPEARARTHDVGAERVPGERQRNPQRALFRSPSRWGRGDPGALLGGSAAPSPGSELEAGPELDRGLEAGLSPEPPRAPTPRAPTPRGGEEDAVPERVALLSALASERALAAENAQLKVALSCARTCPPCSRLTARPQAGGCGGGRGHSERTARRGAGAQRAQRGAARGERAGATIQAENKNTPRA
jgi:hypothetical protein